MEDSVELLEHEMGGSVRGRVTYLEYMQRV